MKKLFIIILLTVFLGACATTPATMPGVDWTEALTQLQLFNAKSVEFKRQAIKTYLTGALIDMGVLSVLFDKSRTKLDPEIANSFAYLKPLCLRLRDNENVTDFELGEGGGHTIFIFSQAIVYGIREVIPQIGKLFGL